MKAGRASATAELVCMGRAAAHARTAAARFSDPHALALLPDAARARVLRQRQRARVGGVGELLWRAAITAQCELMAARTVAIDDVVRAAPADAQLVILGAGLDSRAWRMPELAGRTVFEVDHPDTQRDKRARAASLTAVAREVRFVPVDFTRDALDDELARAGHDASTPTIWLWEGVVMYLTPQAIGAPLAVLERRSAPGSTLAALYVEQRWSARALGVGVALLGEPYRSRFRAGEFARLLARYGFDVVADSDARAWARACGVSALGALVRANADRLAVAVTAR